MVRKFTKLKALCACYFVLALSFANAASYDYDNSCNPCCDPCDFSLCDAEWEVGVDFLWVKPCVDNLEYAAERIEISSEPDIADYKYKYVCPDWEAGFRITLGSPNFYCGFGTFFSYTCVNFCESSSFESSEEIISAITHTALLPSDSGEAKGKWDAKYHEWDLLFSYDVLCNRCHHLSNFFGVAGISLDQEFKSVLGDDVYTVKFPSPSTKY